MSLVLMVRHAQASFGAANYDRLSDLGRRQSRWLGEYFAGRGVRFSRVMSGTLERQRDTASEVLGAMGGDPASIEIHEGLDEYHGEALFRAYTGADPRDALRAAAAGTARDDVVLVVSSGGAISRAVADIVSSPASTAIEMNLHFRNTGVCELIWGAGRFRLLSFNGAPHLDHPQRRESITFA